MRFAPQTPLPSVPAVFRGREVVPRWEQLPRDRPAAIGWFVAEGASVADRLVTGSERHRSVLDAVV